MKTDTIDHQPYEGERDRPGRSVACPAQQPHQTSIFNLQPTPSPIDTALVAKSDVSRALRPDVPLVNHPLILSSNTAPCGKKPRNGKVARLPKPVRDTVNRMLFNEVPQENIAAALEEIGIHVTQRNISNWKTRGGYREWRLAQEYGIQLHVNQDNLLDLLRRHHACELPELGL